MRLCVLVAVGALLAALPAQAELKGVDAYERGDYVRARKLLTDQLQSPGLSKEDQAKARLYLAAALFASGAETSARSQLEELAKLAPAFQVDPILFPPAFVALAEKARTKVEAERKEQERQEAERKEAESLRLEAERKAREEAEAQAQQQPPPPPEEEASRPLRLRPDVFGFMDVLGDRVGMGGGLTLGLGQVDLSARVLMGKRPGVGGEVGLLLGSSAVQPRLALRGTAVPAVSAYGGGAVVGLRLAATQRLIFLVDVGAEYLTVNDKNLYRTFALTSSAGVGFDLL